MRPPTSTGISTASSGRTAPAGRSTTSPAIGVDAHGRILRLFTVNRWVVGDDWLDAEGTITLLRQFDLEMPRPSYLVNRWLTAVFVAYEDEIAGLVRARDRAIAAHVPAHGVATREDRALEVTSELAIGPAKA